VAFVAQWAEPGSDLEELIVGSFVSAAPNPRDVDVILHDDRELAVALGGVNK